VTYPFSDADRARIRANRRRLFVGSPGVVKERLLGLAEAAQADELMVASAIYDHDARRRSYELLAGVFQHASALAPAEAR